MNKLLLFLFILCAAPLVAQPGHERGGHNERLSTEERADRFARIKAARQAFITEELELSKQQATSFFPVYWAYEKRMARDRNEPRHGKTDIYATGKMTEAEARSELLQRRTRRQKMLALSLEAEDKYLELLPATKVIRLPETEKAFRRKLWDHTRKRKRN
jgi:hypothetical protein